MKILFVYFNRKQICGTAEQAIEFINSLHYRNLENQPQLAANQHTKDLLSNVFASEWKHRDIFNARNEKIGEETYIMLPHRMIEGQLKICTTNCRGTEIYGYCPMADTVEEHDRILLEREAKRDQERAEKREAAVQKRLEKLYEQKNGWYRVSLDLRLMVFNNHGNDYMEDTTFTGDIIADSGADAYNKTVKHILDSPSEVVNYHGNASTLQSWSDMTSYGYEFYFLGVKTDDGYSVEKWKEWKENGEI